MHQPEDLGPTVHSGNFRTFNKQVSARDRARHSLLTPRLDSFLGPQRTREPDWQSLDRPRGAAEANEGGAGMPCTFRQELVARSSLCP